MDFQLPPLMTCQRVRQLPDTSGLIPPEKAKVERSKVPCQISRAEDSWDFFHEIVMGMEIKIMTNSHLNKLGHLQML